MALQASAGLSCTKVTPLSPPHSASSSGLRKPSDRFALKSAFFSSSVHLLLPPSRRAPSAPAPKFSMRVASKQAYICRDCGYIYNDRTPFEKQSDSYFCPGCASYPKCKKWHCTHEKLSGEQIQWEAFHPFRCQCADSSLSKDLSSPKPHSHSFCGAPKRRFRSYEPKVTKNANDTNVRKERKEQLKRDEAIGKALPVAIALGVVALAGLYFYLNNAF